MDRLVLAAAVVTAAAALSYLAEVGGYYLLPLWERPDSPLHAVLRGSGAFGHPFGIAGVGLIVVGVSLYSTRKRAPAMRGVGPLRTWLNLHIYLCLTGPFLLTLHSTLKFRGLGAYSYWSMLIVAASGVAGRWLFQQFPRTIRGSELTLDEIRAELAETRTRLGAADGLPADILAEVDAAAERGVAAARTRHLLTALPLLLWDDVSRPFRLRGLSRKVRDRDPVAGADLETLLMLVRRRVTLARRVAFLDLFRRVFDYWHVAHLVFFVAMFALLVLHVGAALFFGARLAGR